MTIYDIPSIVRDALPKSVTPANILAGFRCTGIVPYNRDIFTDLDFAPSAVTDRPEVSVQVDEETPNNYVEAKQNTGKNFPFFISYMV